MSNWREQVTNDTEEIVDQLIFIKENIDELSKDFNKYIKISTAASSLLIVYALAYFWLQIEENILFAATAFITNFFHLFWLIIVIYIFAIQKRTQAILDKEKNRLEKLRLETIDHLKNTWYINKYSSIRDAISLELEGKGINVRYKSK